MLLTIDLGNTCIKLGLFEKDKEIVFDLFDSVQDDYKAMFLGFIYKTGYKENQIDDIIISSVVPNIKKKLLKTIKNVFNIDAIEIDITKNYGNSRQWTGVFYDSCMDFN